MSDIEIGISKPSFDFGNHLNLPGNDRIFFSGVFGLGKTYFLEKFFKENSEKYYSIRLNPVNYSISQTEDIFRITKFEILLNFLDDEDFKVSLVNEDFEEGDYLKIVAIERLVKLLYGVIKNIPVVGKTYSSIYDKVIEPLVKFKKDLDDGRKRLKESEEFQILKEAMSGLEDLHYYDQGFMDDFISSKLEEIVLAKKEKKSLQEKPEKILIIDDLDRLDPEHIFRLLNVFSAQIDWEEKNKFGFDKVIFVGDIDNIRSIFYHKYGLKTDFDGYIDKFFSRDIFNFDNREEVLRWISDYIERIPVLEGNVLDKKYLEKKYPFHKSIVSILYQMVSAKAIGLRSLISLEKGICIPPRELYLKGVDEKLSNSKIEVIYKIEFLNAIFGNVKEFIAALEKTVTFVKNGKYPSFSEINFPSDKEVVNLLILVDRYSHRVSMEKLNTSISFLFSIDSSGLVKKEAPSAHPTGRRISYKLNRYPGEDTISTEFDSGAIPNLSTNYYFNFLLTAVLLLEETGYLN